MRKIHIILIFLVFCFVNCSHDLSELENTKDTNQSDVKIYDAIYDDRIVNDTITDNYSDLYTDIESDGIFIDMFSDIVSTDEAGDLIHSDYIEEIIDIKADDIEDTIFTDIKGDVVSTDTMTDVISDDLICNSECETAGEKECITINQKEYVRECKDQDGDGCFEWVNIEYCNYGCNNAECKSCAPDCINKECGDDGCGGSCGDCSKLPPNECIDNNKLKIYISGECKDHKCNFSSNIINCTYGCDSGKCLDCRPSCSGKNCGPDGCGGFCGECNSLEFCNNSGICECKYINCNGKCCNANEICFNWSCCQPSCSGKDCGPDGCGGFCGDCGQNERCEGGICVPINP